METSPTRIDLLGRKHAVTLPDFATREELFSAWVEARNADNSARLMRVYSATLGLCTRIGRESGASYPACRCDVLAYGGLVYSWLRDPPVNPTAEPGDPKPPKAKPEEIVKAALPILLLIAEATYPREVEVEAEKKDSPAAEPTE
jgi:hypothetical protein